jgi:hypothetical protein
VGRAAREGREEGERAWKVSAEDVKARGYNLDIKNPHTVAEDHGDPETLLGDLTAAEAEVAAPPRPAEGDPVRGARPMNADRLLALYERWPRRPTPSPACAASCWTSPCGGSWWRRIRRTNRRRSC